MWKSEGIIFPRKSKNVQNSFMCFQNYTQEETLKMVKLDLFLVFSPVGYLSTILIPYTNTVFNYPLDLGGIMRWVGC